MYPPEIVTTSRKQDSIIYSPFEKQGIVIELAVPAENLAQAKFRGKKNPSVQCRMGDDIFPCRGRIKRIHI